MQQGSENGEKKTEQIQSKLKEVTHNKKLYENSLCAIDTAQLVIKLAKQT